MIKLLIRTLHHYFHALELRADLLYEVWRQKENLKGADRSFLSVAGSLLRHPAGEECMIRLLRFAKSTDTILLFDIGANTGYWLEHFIQYFPKTSAHAFEPTQNAFIDLENRFHGHPGIYLYNKGLSNCHEEKEISVAVESTFSSLHQYEVSNQFTGRELVELDRFDSLFGKNSFTERDCTIVKIDVQGHEIEVVEGMSGSLSSIDVVIIECSILPEYVGMMPSFAKISSILEKGGLYPVIFNDFGRTESPYPMQRDVIYVRPKHFIKLMKW